MGEGRRKEGEGKGKVRVLHFYVGQNLLDLLPSLPVPLHTFVDLTRESRLQVNSV